jgi:hypothetical protein
MNPTMITLNSGLLYHRVKREIGFACPSWACSTSGSCVLSDMLVRRLAGRHHPSYTHLQLHTIAPPMARYTSQHQSLQAKSSSGNVIGSTRSRCLSRLVRMALYVPSMVQFLSEHSHRCSRCEMEGCRVVLDAKFYVLDPNSSSREISRDCARAVSSDLVGPSIICSSRDVKRKGLVRKS